MMHDNRSFSTPQRQSPLGILFIFGASVYKFLRAFWVLGAYLLLNKTVSDYTNYLIGFIVILGFGLAFYSYRSYQKFLFHINYKEAEFVLREGVFENTETLISFDKIQQVYFKRGILQRTIDVYEVVIDTAGSQNQEIIIKALSRKNAEALQEILMQEAYASNEQTTDTEDQHTESKTTKADWYFRLSNSTLLRLGLTTNYLKGVWVLLFFVISLLQQTDNYPGEETIYNTYNSFLQQENWYYLVLVGLVLLLVAGIIITTLEIFIKYYNLELKQTGEELQLQMGLRTQTRVAIKPRRVQILSIITNPIQQGLNLFSVKVALANSIERSEKSDIKIPGLSFNNSERLKRILLGDSGTDAENAKHYAPNILIYFRKCIASFMIIPVVLVCAYIFPLYVDKLAIVLGLSLYLIVVGTLQWFRYKAIAIYFSDEFLVKKSGLWTKKKEVIPLYKIQSISIKQPLWYKNRNLVNLYIHTAAGDRVLPAMDAAVLDEVNYTIYKAESSNKAWM